MSTVNIDWQKIGKPAESDIPKPEKPTHIVVPPIRPKVSCVPKVVRVTEPERPNLPEKIANNYPPPTEHAQPQKQEPVYQNHITEEPDMSAETFGKARSSPPLRQVANQQPAAPAPAPAPAAKEKAPAEQKEYAAGLEILGLDFLLSVVENTVGDDDNDIEMRVICFDELFRRNQLHEIDSKSMKVYAMDVCGYYGKDIQCQAMKVLLQRTA